MRVKNENISIRGVKISNNTGSIQEKYTSVGNNTGNMLITYALANVLDCYNIKDFFESPDYIEKIMVLTLANQIHPTNLKLEKFLKGLISFWTGLDESIKLVGASLGAQTPLYMDAKAFFNGYIKQKQVYIDFINTIIDRAPSSFANLAVRGYFTYEIFKELGLENKVSVLGCPSHLISEEPFLGQIIYNRLESIPVEKMRFDTNLGAPQINEWRFMENKLIDLAIKTGGKIHVQAELKYIKFADNSLLEQHEEQEIMNELTYILNQGISLQDLRENFKVWWDVRDWLQYISKHANFVIGTRIHGTIAALQVGIPALCIAIDSRTFELCEFLKIPFMTLDEFSKLLELDIKTFKNVIIDSFYKKFDARTFDKNRLEVAYNYYKFFRQNFIRPNIKLFYKLKEIFNLFVNIERIFYINGLIIKGNIYTEKAKIKKIESEQKEVKVVYGLLNNFNINESMNYSTSFIIYVQRDLKNNILLKVTLENGINIPIDITELIELSDEASYESYKL